MIKKETTQTIAQPEAEELYRQGISHILDENGKKRHDADFASAIPYLQQASELGHVEAQATLGSCYANGYGVACNYEQAHHWFAKAAEQGNAKAQYGLGLCYQRGDAVECDNAQAVHWFRKSAEQDFTGAKVCLALHYSMGLGIEQCYWLW